MEITHGWGGGLPLAFVDLVQILDLRVDILVFLLEERKDLHLLCGLEVQVSLERLKFLSDGFELFQLRLLFAFHNTYHYLLYN